jgi:prevent-host-death family protein
MDWKFGMPVVGLRQLSRETRTVVKQLDTDGQPVVITDRGRPVAALVAITEQDAAAYALAVTPEFAASRDRATAAIAAGQGKPASRIRAELEARESRRNRSESSREQDQATDAMCANGQAMQTTRGLAHVATSLAGVSFPPSLLNDVMRIALGEATAAGLSEPDVRRANEELVKTLLRESVAGVAERVRAVNENIVAELGGANDLSLTTYTSELEQVASAERLAIPGGSLQPVRG